MSQPQLDSTKNGEHNMTSMITVYLMTATLALTTPIEGLKRPGLTIPQGMIESGLNKRARGKAGEVGAWQVLEKYHGKVPKGLAKQAAHHEQIMDTLIRSHKGSIPEAVMRYNSWRNIKAGNRYLAKVRKRALEYYFIA